MSSRSNAIIMLKHYLIKMHASKNIDLILNPYTNAIENNNTSLMVNKT